MTKKKIPVRTHSESDSEPVSPARPVDGPANADVNPESDETSEDVGGGETRPGSREEASPADSGAELRAELDAAKDRALRCQAELENYRRRAARESEQQQRYCELSLLRDLLPVWDNVHRAIEAGERAGGDPNLLQGFAMVVGQLEDVLRRHDCQKIEALYQPFDPNLHEAITQQPSTEHPAGTVIGETQTGFRLHDRVVRASQVIVSFAPTAPAADASEAT